MANDQLIRVYVSVCILLMVKLTLLITCLCSLNW